MSYQRILIIVFGVALFGCQDNPGPDTGLYRVEIVRTGYGVPHITADNFASLGYGEGYAAAEDHACNISHALVAARGELARYFGPGDDDANIASDAVVRAMDIRTQALAALSLQDEDNLAWLKGYADGYNRYLSSANGSHVGSWCDGAPWVQSVTDLDLMSRMVLMAQTLPQMAAALVAAQPPIENVDDKAALDPATARQLATAADAAGLSGMGSNAWAFGRERTGNGRGLLLGNPHYPWYGDSRFWEKHLTIPGTLDVYGVHLLGAPGVSIGFNRNVGWSHTVSDSQRVVFYALDLVPGDPTRYYYDGAERAMTRVTVQVLVKQEDDRLETVDHTLYSSHYGPILTLPDMPWSEATAYTARDANRGNYHLLSQWRAMGQARDMDGLIAAHRQWNAMPWVNTIATSDDGRALYIDNSTVGHLSDEAIALWRSSLDTDLLVANVYARRGFILVDGSDSRFEWQLDGGSHLPGTVPFDERPLLESTDYVFNANDSYWLSNAEVPLSGYSPLYGPEATARSLRTRKNVLLIRSGELTSKKLQQALFANNSLAAELLQTDLVAACEEVAEVAAACTVIAAFDGTFNEDSAGAPLFREWLATYDYEDTLRTGTLFAVPFDATAPVSTPHTLADPTLAVQKLAQAAAVLQAAGLPLDAALGDVQFAYRGGQRIPLHGGNRFEGVANLMVSGDPEHPIAPISPQSVGGSKLLTDAGYPVVHGSSFIFTLAFDDDGPVAEALLTYSQSGDPASAHFTDQTELYRNKQWRPALFDREAIERNTKSTMDLIGPRN